MSQGLKELVLFWNEKAAEVLNFHTNPGDDARRMAVIHIAIHDALNSTRERYRRYALGGKLDPSASAEAAVCKAAQLAVNWTIEDVRNFVNTNPFMWTGLKNQLTDNYSSVNDWAIAKQSQVNAWYNHWMPTKGEVASFLEGRKGGLNGAKGWADKEPEVVQLINKQRKAGEDIGEKAFIAIRDKRSTDGRNLVDLLNSDPAEGTAPGEFQGSYYKFPPPPKNKFLSTWGQHVVPFVTESHTSFRQGGPHPVNGPAYANDYEEVKRKGVKYDSTRNEAENAIVVNVRWATLIQHVAWNNFLAEIVNRKNMDAWDAVRLFALANTAMADGASAMFMDIYHFKHWRPITAITFADDGNEDTVQDVSWTPFADTPRVPEYPSIFGIFGGIVESIIHAMFSDDALLRNEASEAAHENAIGKIYCGWNFRKSAEDGLKQGRLIGRYVLDHAFRPVIKIAHPQPVPKPSVVGNKWKRRV